MNDASDTRVQYVAISGHALARLDSIVSIVGSWFCQTTRLVVIEIF